MLFPRVKDTHLESGGLSSIDSISSRSYNKGNRGDLANITSLK